MEDKPSSEANEPTKMERAPYHLIKTDSYRSYFANGAWGGLTPQGNIYMEFYLERFPTPTYMEHQITSEGKVGEEIPGSRKGKEGIIRQIEAGVVFDIDTARRMRAWLDGQIQAHTKLIEPKD